MADIAWNHHTSDFPHNLFVVDTFVLNFLLNLFNYLLSSVER